MINIIAKRKYFYILSSILIITSIIFVSIFGLKSSIDFTGGTFLEIQFSNGYDINKQNIVEKLNSMGLENPIVQESENKRIFIRHGAQNDDINTLVLEKIKELDENAVQLRIEYISSSVSKEIKDNAFLAIISAIVAIALYIAWAFRKVSRPIASWKYGLWAIVALTHDIVIVIGFFALLGRLYGVEVGIPFIAALLTILGYSVNDTIVVYDRIRENIMKTGGHENFEVTVDRSIKETIARSINTSLTVLIVLVGIIIFGGESIKFFAIALFLGVVVGTYSSIFIASALLVSSYNHVLKLRKKE